MDPDEVRTPSFISDILYHVAKKRIHQSCHQVKINENHIYTGECILDDYDGVYWMIMMDR
jgi:hypothetical protein